MKALRSELLKVFLNPLLYVFLAILIILTPLFTYLNLKYVNPYTEKDFNMLPSLLVFSYGCQLGLPLAGYIIVAFSCMLFAGEFDRGTIKNLLTRPVTRTNLYFAKVMTAIIIACMFYFAVIWSSFFFATVTGEMGNIWADESFQIRSSAQEMSFHFGLAILMSFVSFLCLALLGVAISNMINNSGYAVATGLIFLVVLSIAVRMVRESTQLFFFNYYIGYAYETLRDFSVGTVTARWDPKILKYPLSEGGMHVPIHIIVPAAYAFIFMTISYITFKFKQIIA